MIRKATLTGEKWPIARAVAVLLASLGLLLGLGVGPASASVQNNPGSCSLAAGVVNMNVREDPTENSVRYVSVASPVQLDITSGSRADAYLSSNGDWHVGRWLYSAPVDGDGFWNYRADFNIVNTGGSTDGIGRIFFTIKRYNSSSHCGTSVYI
jgi:hypothetical protein